MVEETETIHLPDDMSAAAHTLQETIEVKLDERSVLARIAQNEGANRQLLRAFLQSAQKPAKKLHRKRRHLSRMHTKLPRIVEESPSQEESRDAEETRSERDEVDARLSIIEEEEDEARDDLIQSASAALSTLFAESKLEWPLDDVREGPQASEDLTDSEFDDDEWSEMAQRSLPELLSYDSINLFTPTVKTEKESSVKTKTPPITTNEPAVKEEELSPPVTDKETKEASIFSGNSTVLTHLISSPEEDSEEPDEGVRLSRQELLTGCMGTRPSSARQHASVRRAKTHQSKTASTKVPSLDKEQASNADKDSLPIKKERDVPIEDDPCGAMAHILTIEVEMEEKKKPAMDATVDVKRNRQELLTGCIGARPSRVPSFTRRPKPTYTSIDKVPKVHSCTSFKDREKHRVKFADTVALIACGVPGLHRTSRDSASASDESSCRGKRPDKKKYKKIGEAPSFESNPFYHFFVWEDDEDIYTYDDQYEGVQDEYYYEDSVGSITDMSSYDLF